MVALGKRQRLGKADYPVSLTAVKIKREIASRIAGAVYIVKVPPRREYHEPPGYRLAVRNVKRVFCRAVEIRLRIGGSLASLYFS